jgi:DNA-directed RNA polymerase subunit L
MNPQISNISEEGDIYRFTLSDINVSLANALRRTILSDIPTYGFYTETYSDSQCVIHVNTTRLHNEIIKQRLSCIPIHEVDLTLLVGKYQLDLDMQNDTEDMIIITTEHFRIRNKETGNYLTKDETRRIFPPNNKTNCFIEFARIRPKIGDSIPGEQLKLVADFSIRTAFENTTFNVVSKCSYGNTIDVSEVAKIWEERESKLRSEETPASDIAFQKKNFYLLDAQRHFVTNSFDFVIQTVGVYDNREILKKGCVAIIKKLTRLIEEIDSEVVPILNGETTMDYCFDVILENEDYTIGKVLEYILYESYYVREKIFSYCGFKKFHPHNADSTIRIAYESPADKRMVGQHLRIACTEAADVFYKLNAAF